MNIHDQRDLEGAILVVGSMAAYLIVTIAAYRIATKATERSGVYKKSIIRGAVYAILFAPSFIGTEGFGLPAPALAALIAVPTVGNHPSAITFSAGSILVCFILISANLVWKNSWIEKDDLRYEEHQKHNK